MTISRPTGSSPHPITALAKRRPRRPRPPHCRRRRQTRRELGSDPAGRPFSRAGLKGSRDGVTERARESYRRMCPRLPVIPRLDKAQQRATHSDVEAPSGRHQAKMLGIVEIPDLPASAGAWLGLLVRRTVGQRRPQASGFDGYFCADDQRFGPRPLDRSRQFGRYRAPSGR